MRVLIRTGFLISILGALAIIAMPAHAAGVNQRTGDGIVPSIETVCDGDPYSFGLCNAYCEALDCEDPTPLGTPRACANLLNNYKKKSGGAAPPCACPCQFNVAPGFLDHLADLAVQDGFLDSVNLNAITTFCSPSGPNGEEAFAAEAFEEDEDSQGIRLYYWVGVDPDTCNEVGGGTDGTVDEPDLSDDVNGWSYGPFIVNHQGLTAPQVGACQTVFNRLCPPE